MAYRSHWPDQSAYEPTAAETPKLQRALFRLIEEGVRDPECDALLRRVKLSVIDEWLRDKQPAVAAPLA